MTKALTDMMKSKQDLDPTNNIVSGLLKAAMAGTDAKKQNGEVSAVNNSSSETKRPPITLKSILRRARNGSTLRRLATHKAMINPSVVNALQPDEPMD